MAITLSALARLLPLAQGTAFGIASFSLAIGALPALLGVRVSSAHALVVLSLASLVLLELGLAFMRRQGGDE
jgi:FSR family fosmidomycin resistance protein-like MFS transporter